MLGLPKNIYIISLVMSLCLASTSMMVLVSGLLGSQLAPKASLATLPMSIMIIAIAVSTLPASFIMQKVGRKLGMMFSIVIAIFGAALGYFSAIQQHFYLLLVAVALLGFNIAFIQQGRFIIIENAHNENQQADGLTLALLSGLIAAVVGPQLGASGKNLINNADYAGSFLLLILILACALISMLAFSNSSVDRQTSSVSGRPLLEIMRQPSFILSAGSAAVAYAVMSLVMTATPVSMHEMDGHSMTHTKWVIQSHIVAMFLPSIITGQLLKKGYRMHLIIAGLIQYIAVSLIAFNGAQVMHYWWALLLLGTGWNAMFLASTSILPNTYQESEKFKAQATNDFLVFSLQAIAAFSAGWLLFNVAWSGVLWVGLILSISWLIIVLILRSKLS